MKDSLAYSLATPWHTCLAGSPRAKVRRSIVLCHCVSM